MKYTVMFTGITVLSSVTQAAYLPRYSKSEIANAYSIGSGPEFPVTLPKRKNKRGHSLEKRSKPHCAARGQWKCYRKHLKNTIREGKEFDSDSAKEFCYATGERKPHCDTSDEDDIDPHDMAEILKEIEEDKQNEEEKKKADEKEAKLEAEKEATRVKEEAEDEAAEKERLRLEALRPTPTPFVDPLRKPDESEHLPPR